MREEAWVIWVNSIDSCIPVIRLTELTYSCSVCRCYGFARSRHRSISSSSNIALDFNPSFDIDTGEAKREMVLKLGAEKWVDFKESQDLIKDIKAATDGGPQAAIVAAGDVRHYLSAVLIKDVYSGVLDSGKAFQPSHNVSARNWHTRFCRNACRSWPLERTCPSISRQGAVTQIVREYTNFTHFRA